MTSGTMTARGRKRQQHHHHQRTNPDNLDLFKLRKISLNTSVYSVSLGSRATGGTTTAKGRHDNGRHGANKMQQGDMWHKGGDGRHDDGTGQQGVRRHNDGDGRHDNGNWRQDDERHNDGKGQKEAAAPPPPPPAYQPQHHRENDYKS
jgi:hypothetical protein